MRAASSMPPLLSSFTFTPSNASFSLGMSEARWQASSAMIGMFTRPRTQRVSSIISAGSGCSMNSTPIFSSQLIFLTASSLSFHPSLASTRSGFLVTLRTASIVGSSVARPTFTFRIGKSAASRLFFVLPPFVGIHAQRLLGHAAHGLNRRLVGGQAHFHFQNREIGGLPRLLFGDLGRVDADRERSERRVLGVESD